MKKPKKILSKIVNEIVSKRYFLLLVILVSYASYKYAFGFYFVHDDWALLWSSKYNPEDFYHSTVGSYWFVRTGLFHLFYYQLHSLIENSYHWQLIGFGLKVINSIIFYYFVRQITKNNHLAYLGGLLFASYAGGVQAYTWHVPTAWVIMFLLLALRSYSKFLEKFEMRHFWLFVFFITLSFLSYIGRMIAVFPLLIFWNTLLILKGDNKTKKTLTIVNISFLILLFIVSKFMPSFTGDILSYMAESAKSYKIFFESIGNLLKVPYFETPELGGLAEASRLSFAFGLLGAAFGLVLFVMYVATKKEKYMYLTIAVVWIYGFYAFNWLYGGGGVSTLVGSIHRYLSVSAVGVVFLMVLLIKMIPAKYQSIAVMLLVFWNISHSDRINKIEGSVRYKSIVEPIYKQTLQKMENDNDVQLVVIDTPNKLKSFVVGGWYPYTYAYYKGLPELKDFPVVIAFWDHGVKWVCADDLGKKEVQAIGGFGSNRESSKIDIDHIYAWTLSEDGQLTDRTSKLRNIASECIKDI